MFWNSKLVSKVISILIIQSFFTVNLSWANDTNISLRAERHLLSPALSISQPAVKTYFKDLAGKGEGASILLKGSVKAVESVGEVSRIPNTKEDNFYLLNEIPKLIVDFNMDNRVPDEPVLNRVNLNHQTEPDGSFKDTTRFDNIKETVDFELQYGMTPVLYGHNGSLSLKKDNRQSLEKAAGYIQSLYPDKIVIFHKPYSLGKDKNGLEWFDITKDINGNDLKIVNGAINIIENLRFDKREQGSSEEQRELAQRLMNFAGKNKKFVFDAFGDTGSKGASVQVVPLFADEIYCGPSMLSEFNELRKVLEEGIDAIVFGGEKMDKIPLLKALLRVLKEGGFALIGSGPSNSLDKEPALLQELLNIKPGSFIKAEDYSDSTYYDIGSKSVVNFHNKLGKLSKGQTVLVNGTMGYMEEKSGKYQYGTEQVWKKLKQLAGQGVRIIIVGGNASETAQEYGLDKMPNVVIFSGGGVTLKILAGELLTAIKALSERQREILKTQTGGKDISENFNKIQTEKKTETVHEEISSYFDLIARSI